jgi:hypothetical protein
MWPNARLTKLFGIEHPILLAPMAGAMDFELVMTGRPARGIFNRVMRELGPMGEAPDSARRRCAGAAARQGRGGGIWRVLADVVRTSGCLSVG